MLRHPSIAAHVTVAMRQHLQRTPKEPTVAFAMSHSKPPSDDPAQLPVEPEFPTDDAPTNPHSDEGEPGADENAAGFGKPKL
jgi:hypothetical protein